ncbi:MAG: hypothetical protein JJU28_08280 [Cyclobacteriaceae bacterium]|nr:hypothetical protein [Cyclobacteriaceae bacterium]
MNRLFAVLEALVLSGVILCAFLIWFDARVSIPAWLQVAGRLHPLILHFPIVFVVLWALAEIFGIPGLRDAQTRDNWFKYLRAITAVLLVYTSLFGLILSLEPGYEKSTALLRHQWSGMALSLLAVFVMFGMGRLSLKAGRIISVAGLILVMITGHFGAGLTHGSQFLTAPLQKSRTDMSAFDIETALVFEYLIKPVLEQKCISCHNDEKIKGELRMLTVVQLQQGGASGPAVVPGVPDQSLLIQRLHLPLEHDEHMPPKGKPQPRDREIALLEAWIKAGLPEGKITELSEEDPFKIWLLEQGFLSTAKEAYAFKPAPASAIQKLDNENRVIRPLYASSPALQVNFFNSNMFKGEMIAEMKDIAEQIVAIDFSKMPLTDEHVSHLKAFKNLEKITANFTQITGAGLVHLKDLEQLKYLAVSGTGIRLEDLEPLKELPALKTIYLWNTPAASALRGGSALSWQGVLMETGFEDPGDTLKLTPPVFVNKEVFYTDTVELQLKHPIPGVEIRISSGEQPPDSSSELYQKGRIIRDHQIIKARAFKEGWHQSDVSSKFFINAGHRADTIWLETQEPDTRFRAEGIRTISDRFKSDNDFLNGMWVGYREVPMVVVYKFKEDIRFSSLVIDHLIRFGTHIFPPEKVEIFTGSAPSQLSLVYDVKPAQPGGWGPTESKPLILRFDEQKAKVIKVVIHPLSKLPSWHNKKGEKGWVFVDEIVIH